MAAFARLDAVMEIGSLRRERGRGGHRRARRLA